jgi:hypothetical protein
MQDQKSKNGKVTLNVLLISSWNDTRLAWDEGVRDNATRPTPSRIIFSTDKVMILMKSETVILTFCSNDIYANIISHVDIDFNLLGERTTLISTKTL